MAGPLAAWVQHLSLFLTIYCLGYGIGIGYNDLWLDWKREDGEKVARRKGCFMIMMELDFY